MSRLPLKCLAIVLVVGAVSCGDPSTTPNETPAQLAKGGPNPTQFLSVTTIEDAGTDLTSDGKGPYQNNVCGVSSVANLWNTGTWGFQMAPNAVRIPKSQAAACAGIAPRAASLRLAVKHLSSTPVHVDDIAPVDAGTFALGNLALTSLGGSLFNSAAPCGLRGLRLDSQNFPGSNDLIREELGNGLWHLYTAAYPANLAYCENNGVISYWHVVMSIRVQVL